MQSHAYMFFVAWKRTNNIHLQQTTKKSTLWMQKCDLIHTENMDTLSLNCKSIKKKISKKHFDRSLLKWNHKCCSRCNCITMGINRGYRWYCNSCNRYLLEYLDGRKSTSYNVNDTTLGGGQFIYCRNCNSLWLNYGLTIKCYNVDIS